jgi:hypothetical protein
MPANLGDYANAADAIFGGGVFGAAFADGSQGGSSGGSNPLPPLPPLPIPFPGSGGNAIGLPGAPGAASGRAIGADFGAGIIEWLLVLVAIITLVVAFEADSKIGAGLLVIFVLLMLYSAHRQGIV